MNFIQFTDIEFVQVVSACLDYVFLGYTKESYNIPYEEAKKVEMKLAKSILHKLKKEAERRELHDIVERLDAKWRDDDSPAGEYSSSSSPVLIDI